MILILCVYSFFLYLHCVIPLLLCLSVKRFEKATFKGAIQNKCIIIIIRVGLRRPYA
jgi:hypothetical protein